jgi:hypothetical protein
MYPPLSAALGPKLAATPCLSQGCNVRQSLPGRPARLDRQAEWIVAGAGAALPAGLWMER